jgi:hypothetical protein
VLVKLIRCAVRAVERTGCTARATNWCRSVSAPVKRGSRLAAQSGAGAGDPCRRVPPRSPDRQLWPPAPAARAAPADTGAGRRPGLEATAADLIAATAAFGDGDAEHVAAWLDVLANASAPACLTLLRARAPSLPRPKTLPAAWLTARPTPRGDAPLRRPHHRRDVCSFNSLSCSLNACSTAPFA